MTLQELYRAVLELTYMRRQFCLSNDMIISTGSIREPLDPKLQEIEAKRQALENELEVFYVIWDSVNNSYGVIPKARKD